LQLPTDGASGVRRSVDVDVVGGGGAQDGRQRRGSGVHAAREDRPGPRRAIAEDGNHNGTVDTGASDVDMGGQDRGQMGGREAIADLPATRVQGEDGRPALYRPWSRERDGDDDGGYGPGGALRCGRRCGQRATSRAIHPVTTRVHLWWRMSSPPVSGGCVYPPAPLVAYIWRPRAGFTESVCTHRAGAGAVRHAMRTRHGATP